MGERREPADSVITRLEEVWTFNPAVIFSMLLDGMMPVVSKVLRKDKARILMRATGPLSDDELAIILNVAEGLAKKHPCRVNLKPEIQDKLTGIAKSVGLELEFVEGLPVRFYGCQHVEVPLAVINSDQPQCEQIFTILHEIAHYELHCKRTFTIKTRFSQCCIPSQLLAEIAYRAKRVCGQFGREWQADGWALTAYFLLVSK